MYACPSEVIAMQKVVCGQSTWLRSVPDATGCRPLHWAADMGWVTGTVVAVVTAALPGVVAAGFVDVLACVFAVGPLEHDEAITVTSPAAATRRSWIRRTYLTGPL